MKQQELEALLGRPLTPTEASNRALYLEIANESLFGEGSLLCLDPCQDDGERVFEKREGMSTVFTGIFTKINSVKVDGEDAEYVPYFWDNRNSDFYNSIVLTNNCGREVVVDAEWGFECLPKDLKRLLAQAFAIVSVKRQVKKVKSKKIEDFSITYGDLSEDDQFVADNVRVIDKYRMCDVGYVRHGRTCTSHERRNCGHCI